VDDLSDALGQRVGDASLIENALTVFIIQIRNENRILFLRKLPLINQKPAESQKISIRMICFRSAYQLPANEFAGFG
jgi:hypothetical protein